MFGNVGLPELLFAAVVSLIVWALPIMALVWALVTLHRLRRGQEQIQGQLAALQSALDARR